MSKMTKKDERNGGKSMGKMTKMYLNKMTNEWRRKQIGYSKQPGFCWVSLAVLEPLSRFGGRNYLELLQYYSAGPFLQR